jgi:hypothetical protein
MPECRSGGFQHLFNLVDEIAQMEGLGQDLGILRRIRIRVQRDGCEAGDEHDLEVWIDFRGAARKFNAVHFRHDNVRQQQGKRLFAQALIGAGAIVEVADGIAGLFKRLHEEAAHVVVVFGQQNSVHSHPPVTALATGPLKPILIVHPIIDKHGKDHVTGRQAAYQITAIASPLTGLT